MAIGEEADDPSEPLRLTQDPIGLAGGVNLYSYAGNNPIRFVDPFGLDSIGKMDAQLAQVITSLRAQSPTFDNNMRSIERSTGTTNFVVADRNPRGGQILGGQVFPDRIKRDGTVVEQTIIINSGSINAARQVFSATGRGPLDIKDVLGHEAGHAGANARTKQWAACPDPPPGGTGCSVNAENQVRRDRNRPLRPRY